MDNRFPQEERIIQQLSAVMLRKLVLNRHKKFWGEKSVSYLFKRLQQEVQELEQSLANGHADCIIDECADVANFAAQIMDVVLIYKASGVPVPVTERRWPESGSVGLGE